MLKLFHLDDQTRRFMLEELDLDSQQGSLYLSSRLTPTGVSNYPRVLRDAILYYNDFWLECELRAREHIKTTEIRHNGRGTSISTVPVTAAQTLAEEEFNRYYIRGVCRVALASSIPEVVVYRAKTSANPSAETQEPIDQRLKAEDLLQDLRANPGMGTILAALNGSGASLSVRLPH